jgi:Ca-activated chloride channel family protein
MPGPSNDSEEIAVTSMTRAGLAACLLVTAWAWGQIRVPNRASTPLFEGREGKERTEIRFDPATNTVTLKLLVQDPNGYFIPNIRRENFVVSEDGARQTNATVDVEHSPVALGLLLEHGGRFPNLNRELMNYVSSASQELFHLMGDRDQIALWMYADQVRPLAGFAEGRTTLEQILVGLKPPDVSETNLYDALVAMPGLLHPADGRPAIVVISSAIDTFSKATYLDAMATASGSRAPIYAISLADPMKIAAEFQGSSVAQHLNWEDAEHKLQEICKASGGRLYSPKTPLDLTAAYDDMMENLKVRYVISYRSSSNKSPNVPRTIRVELLDAATGKPLQITAENGTPVRAIVTLQEAYTPAAASGPAAQ